MEMAILIALEDYPSLAEGNGLENRQVVKAARGFESLILLVSHKHVTTIH